jgi:hypothetical protein
MPPPPSAPVHQFFSVHKEADQSKKRRCNICDKKFSFNTGNHSLEVHLKSKHRNEYQQVLTQKQEAAGSTSSSSSSSSSSASSGTSKKRSFTQFSLQQSFNNVYSKQSIDSLFSTAFACLSLPAQALERQEFINMLIGFRQSSADPPSRKALRRAHLVNAAQLQEKVIDRLKAHSQSAPVTIAVDGWTNVRHDKVTNVIPLCAGQAYYWESIVNILDRNTAELLYAVLCSRSTPLVSQSSVSRNKRLSQYQLTHLLVPNNG